MRLGKQPQNGRDFARRGYRFIGKVEEETPVEIRPGLAEVGPPETASRSKTPEERWTQKRARSAALLALGVAITAAVMLLWLHRKSPGEIQDPQQWQVTQFTAYPGFTDAPAFAPDGSRIAFGWDGGSGGKTQDLYVKALGSEALLRLTPHPAEWISAAWSPGGTQIAFMRMAGADTELYEVSALGGPERKLLATNTPYDLSAPLSWSPDGKWILYDESVPGTTDNHAFSIR